MERPWNGLIPESELEVFRAAGYGKRGAWGPRPALLVVDVNYNFTGDRPEPILESIKRFRNSCGEIAWQTIPRIAALLDAARQHGVPVLYSTQGYRPDALGAGSWGQKNSRVTSPSEESLRFGTEIVKEIAPQPDEVVVRKDKPSAFFGTALASHLVARGIDTVVVTGTTTSGCVRATAVDAFSYNYRVVVVEDCVFDRAETTHRINLFDLQSKYADVVPSREVIDYFSSKKAAT
jgi:nicotinamidase-related amidase